MGHRSIRTCVAVATALLLSGAAAATQNVDRLVVDLMAEKIVTAVDDTGNVVERRVQPETLLPGEEVVYTLTYVNRHTDPADDVTITNPIDPNMIYKSNSAQGEDTRVLFSVDGGSTYGEPADLRIADADGRVRPARPSDYTHVRWVRTRPLESGARSTVAFSAVVR